MREPVFFGASGRKNSSQEGKVNPWEGQRVLIVGMARSGIALAQLLCREKAIVTVNDYAIPDAYWLEYFAFCQYVFLQLLKFIFRKRSHQLLKFWINFQNHSRSPRSLI